MKIVTTEVLPPDASMSGKNTVYLSCSQLNKRSSYGVCLFTIRAFEKGTLRSECECHNPVKCGSCPALQYRKQEQEAGRALFFKPREYIEPVARPLASTKAGAGASLLKWVTVGPKVTDTRSYDAKNQIPLNKFNRADKHIVTPIKPIKKVEPKVEKSALFGTVKVSLADAVTAAATEEATKKPRLDLVNPRIDEEPTKNIYAGMSLLERAKAMRAARG